MVATFARDLFGWRTAKNRRVVGNVADSDNPTSIRIAAGVNEYLGIPAGAAASASTGSSFEALVRTDLADSLQRVAPDRFAVEGGRAIKEFHQYRHLAALDTLIQADHTGTLSTAIGRDYEIKPDVVVSIDIGADRPLLHAFVSCKLTIRSDRVQNVRHEGIVLTRHRRGRQPHVVAVTAEPLPTRLASIGRGTGEIDAIYHVALDALVAAVQECGRDEQVRVLDELINQDRLFDFADLAPLLAV